jgi:hypothetical protein
MPPSSLSSPAAAAAAAAAASAAVAAKFSGAFDFLGPEFFADVFFGARFVVSTCSSLLRHRLHVVVQQDDGFFDDRLHRWPHHRNPLILLRFGCSLASSRPLLHLTIHRSLLIR